MIILQTNNLSKSFGVDTILSNIQIQIQENDRVGLVGINGAGKSTLLKIIAGKMLPDTGEVQIAKNRRFGYLAQDTGLETNNTIWDEMISVFTDLIEKERYIRSLETKMAELATLNNDDDYEKIMDEYANVTEQFRQEGGYSYESKIRGILHGLGFSNFDYKKQSIYTLSGGQKTRLGLTKLLLEEPDLLILDEPTNYLDVETLTWLESYLKSYPGAILVVSHDRYFLDTLVNVIYEIENHNAIKYTGNYSFYIEEKAKNIEANWKKYEKQQDKIAKLEDFVQKNIARASTTRRAQSKRKALEKMDVLDKPSLENRKARFSFETDKVSGNNVLNIKNLAMGFDQHPLFKDVTFNLYKQERVALVGPNGIGKSTLFKIVTKQLQPQNGSILFGSNVTVGYYRQEQEDLHYDKTVLDELWDDYPDLPEKEIRSTLGSFLFSGDDVLKKISDLSGGEKARINLAKLMLRKANFLLLDEPTNHLDIFSREVLENSLIDYQGTIFIISHDRYFLNRVTTRTLELSINGITDYLGNYDYYVEKKQELEENERLNQSKGNEPQKSDKETYLEEKEKQRQERQLKRKIVELEEEIARLEKLIQDLELEMVKPEIYSNHELSFKINEELTEAKKNLEKLMDEWEKTQQELEV